MGIPIVEPTEPARQRSMTHRWTVIAFFVGFSLALISSGGITCERLSGGRPALGLLVSAVETAAGIAAVVATMRPLLATFVDVSPRDRAAPRAYRMATLGVLIPQIAGALAGVGLVHLMLRVGVFRVPPWLSERPAQYVNDGVAAAALLVLVWACASGVDLYLLVLVLLGLTLYGLTAPAWHLDHAPGGFQVTVQQFVVAESVATAVGLGLFRAMFAPGGQSSGRGER